MIKDRKYRQIIKTQSEILLFGKFKHKTVQHVLRTEPDYILWLSSEHIVKFPQEILDLAEDYRLDAIEATYGYNYSNYYDDD